MSSTSSAENYQLKWESHLSYLNMSVSTLYRNEKFADVMLLSSHPNSIFSEGIPAHKLILSSCSRFFSAIFDSTPQIPAQNGIMYIVLPPELSCRSIKILIQYMYCGEATVSNDVLNEVLRGGDLLKIRGLYRNGRNIYTPTNNENQVDNNVHQQQSQLLLQTVPNYSPKLPEKNTDCDIPENSPVVVKSPRQTPISTIPPVEKLNGSISVKKDVAIDPGDENRDRFFGQQSSQSYCNDRNCRKCPPPPVRSPPFFSDIESRRFSAAIEKLNDLPQENLPHTLRNFRRSDSVTIQRNLEKNVTNEQPTTSLSQIQNLFSTPKCSKESGRFTKILPMVKIEPVDFCTDENSVTLVKIKTEVIDQNDKTIERSTSKSDNEDKDDIVKNSLNCDICNENFNTAREWALHSESHLDKAVNSEKTDCVEPPPKKRVLRMSSNCSSDLSVNSIKNFKTNIASLSCELCSKEFEDPGEWVRHMQRKHTETELAISNNKHTSAQKSNRLLNHHDSLQLSKMDKRTLYNSKNMNKTCICGKEFDSYAIMIKHAKSHQSIKK